MKKSTLILSLALLFLFVAFREGFTPDYYNYEDVFNLYHNNIETDDSYGDEIGFQMLCMILPSYRMLLVIHTLLYCVCAFVAIATFVPKDKYHIAFVAMFCIIPFLLLAFFLY